MAIVNPIIDEDGNKIFDVTLEDGESKVTLATANTYVDKNIVFNVELPAFKTTKVDFDLGWSDNYGAVSEVTGSGTTRRTKAVSPQLVPIYKGGKIEVDVSGLTVSAMIFDSDAKLVKTITTFPYEVENKGYVRFKATKSTAITADDLALLHEGVTVSNLSTKDDGSLVCKEENYSFPRWEDLIYGGTITQDGCRVGNELWFFESSNGETRKILRFDASTFTALPDGYHSLGHMNTASVFDDRLIYHPKHLDETDSSGNKTKLYIYIIDNVSDKIKNGLTLTNDLASAIIPITPADPTDRLQWLDTAVWVNKTDIMLFFSAADGNEIHRARLGQNADGSFDGTYTILHTWKGAPIGQVQGVDWDGDTLWVGTNYGALEALQIAFDNSDYYRVVKRVVAKYPEDQSIYSYAVEPESVIRCDGYLYMGGSLNHGDGNYNVIGRAEIGDISTHGNALTHEDLVNAPEIQDLSTLRSSFVYAEDARGDIRKISFETLEACFGGGEDPAIVTDGTWDMTGEVAYVPLPEFSASRTAYIEWEGISKYSEISKDTHLVSIKPNGAITGLDVFGISMITGSSASDPNVHVSGIQPRNMPYDSSVVNHGTVSSTVRYLPDSTGQSRALNSTGLIILPDKAISLSNNNEIDIKVRTSTGALAAFSGYLYFNAFSADTVSVCPNLEVYATNEALTNALIAGTLKPGSTTLNWKLKKFILFADEVSYTTKDEIIEHRGEATIDIRFKNGRPFNAGTGGKLIYSDVKGMFPEPEPEPEPDPGLSDEFKEALAAFMEGVAYAIPNGKTLRNNVLIAMGLPIPPDPEPGEDVEITWTGTVATASNLANTDISWSGTTAIIGGE